MHTVHACYHYYFKLHDEKAEVKNMKNLFKTALFCFTNYVDNMVDCLLSPGDFFF